MAVRSSRVRVVVVDEGLYLGTGLVHRWLSRLGNNLYHNIVAEAPERTGELKAGIIPAFVQHEGTLRILSTKVVSTAPHTRFVIDGTAFNGEGYIYSSKAQHNPEILARMLGGERVDETENAGMWMVIEDGGPRFHLRVHGQKANNFMLAGYDRTARTHPALHPIFPGFLT
jgi:hypothetical protein